MTICLATLHRNPRFIPLALLYLKAYLVEHAGVAAETIQLVEFDQETPHDEMVARLIEADPDVVGLSCYVWNIRKLLALARDVKALCPRARIVLGGPEVGPVAASVLEANDAVDIVVKSEGEIPFAQIVDQLAMRDCLSVVAGICYRDGSRVVDTGDAPPLKDLNLLASPHLPAQCDYAGRIICIETQRGCVFRCNFCFYNKDYSIRNRRFDLDRVKEEILFWLDRDISSLYLMDPVFNLYAERAKEICRFIAEHNHKRIEVQAEVWAEFIDEELASLMAAANFTFLEVGLQTTDQDVLATVERRLKLQKFLDGIGFLKQHALNFEVQLIYGLPGETVTTFRKSLDFAATLDPPRLEVFPLMVLPGTELWRKAEGFQLQFESEPPYYVTSHFSMSADDIGYGWKVNKALKYLGDAKTFRVIAREPGVTFSSVVDAWIAWDAGRAADEPRREKMERFVSDFCASRSLPADFYQQFMALEFEIGTTV
jgi:anaerobic magnesium-protoporphyrin IX monomethyl ester cyclase